MKSPETHAAAGVIEALCTEEEIGDMFAVKEHNDEPKLTVPPSEPTIMDRRDRSSAHDRDQSMLPSNQEITLTSRSFIPEKAGRKIMADRIVSCIVKTMQQHLRNLVSFYLPCRFLSQSRGFIETRALFIQRSKFKLIRVSMTYRCSGWMKSPMSQKPWRKRRKAISAYFSLQDSSNFRTPSLPQ